MLNRVITVFSCVFFLSSKIFSADDKVESKPAQNIPGISSHAISAQGGGFAGLPFGGVSGMLTLSPMWALRLTNRLTMITEDTPLLSNLTKYHSTYIGSGEILLRWPTIVQNIFRTYFSGEAFVNYDIQEKTSFVGLAGKAGLEFFMTPQISSFIEGGGEIPVWREQAARTFSGAVFVFGSNYYW